MNLPSTPREVVLCPNRRFLFTKKKCSVGHVMENTKSSRCEINPVTTTTFARFQVPAAVEFKSSLYVWATRLKAWTGRPGKIGPISLCNPLNAELNLICYLLALLVAHRIFHVSELGVNKNKQNVHFFFVNDLIQLYCLRNVSKTTKCSSSGRLVRSVLWYFFHASV